MSTVRDWLKAGVRVADGGVTTSLQSAGWPISKPAELACLERPELVAKIAKQFLAAGAQLISTNTFGANALAAGHWSEQVDLVRLNQAAVKLAREVADLGEAYVAGVIGPSWKLLAIKEVEPATLQRAFAEQARVLADGGADVLVLETFSELEEAKRALAGAQETDLPVVVSFSFDSGAQRTVTRMRLEARDAAEALQDAGAAGIGANCGAGATHVLPAAVALRANFTGVVWISPNVGPPDLDGDRVVYRQTPEEFCEVVPRLLDAGVNVVGGCCGAGPAHIKRLAAVVEHHRRHPHDHVDS